MKIKNFAISCLNENYELNVPVESIESWQSLTNEVSIDNLNKMIVTHICKKILNIKSDFGEKIYIVDKYGDKLDKNKVVKIVINKEIYFNFKKFWVNARPFFVLKTINQYIHEV